MRWDDLVTRDLQRAFFLIFLQVLYSLGENVWNGTLLRTLCAGWRFGLFYLLSILIMTATVAGEALLAWLTYLGARNFLAGVALSLAAAIVAGVFFLALAASCCRRWLITRICIMWPWYWELAHRCRPDLDVRIDEFAHRIVAKARAGNANEILVVGHSAGGTILIPLIARALELDTDFAGAGSPVTALALGSNLPLAALHPNGDDFRRAIRRVEFYPRLRWNFFCMHYQFIMAKDQRAPYDYFMFVCGPARLLDWAQEGAQTLARFAQDASYDFTGPDPTSRTAATSSAEMTGGQS